VSERKHEVFDDGKVREAIAGVFGVFEEHELTVAETVHVAKAVHAVLDRTYPLVSEIIGRGFDTQ